MDNNMLPRHLDFWYLEFVIMDKEIIKKYPPARYNYLTWWFASKEEAEKFARLVIPAERLGLALMRITKARVVDIMTEDQYEYWSDLLSMHAKENHLSFDYRHLMVADDEQSRITWRAEEMSEEAFIAEYPDHLVELAKRMYYAALDNNTHFEGLEEELRPHISAPELEDFSFSTWENVLFTEGDYEEFVVITDESITDDDGDIDTVRSKFTRV